MKRWTVIIAATTLVIGLGLVALIAGAYYLLKIPSVEDQLDAGSSPVHVQLYAQDTPNGWPMNSFIPVGVQARGGGTIASLELYINGQLYEEVSAPDGWQQPEYSYQWNWQPGTTGMFILVARATGTEGGTGVSDPVQLKVRDAATMITPYQSQEGDTLAGLAAAHGIELAALSEANPQVGDPGQVLPVDTPIDLPNPPVTISNPNLIQGFAGIEDPSLPPQQSGNPPSGPDEGAEEGGLSLPSLQDIQFWLAEETDGNTGSLPWTPSIEYARSGCEATLSLSAHPFNDSGADGAKNEDGFFLYRSQDGGPFERIATLPAVKDEATWKYKDGYKLSGQSGLVTYTISAFNHTGESVSNPVTVDFSSENCQAMEVGRRLLGSTRLDNGDLILPYKMDLAYLYLSLDGSSSIRVPEGHRMFQPDSGVKLNLFDYLSEKMPTFTAADFSLSMEVWGWSGGELQFVGHFEDTVHRSMLLVCSQEGEGACSSGGGTWMTEINFSDHKPVNEQVYEFKWIATQRSEADEVCIQAAAAPYPNDSFWDMGFKPISSGCYYWDGQEYVHGSEGFFTEHMQNLLYNPTPPEDLGWGAGSEVYDFGSNWFASEYPPDSAFTLYFRVLPRMETKGYAVFTNTVPIHHDTPPVPSDLPPLASPYSSTYAVEILRDSYEPPTFETDDKWGCVIVEEDPTGHFAVGQEVCPPPYGTLAKLNSDGCSGNWDFWCTLKGVYKTFTESYDAIIYWYDVTKYEWASMIAETIPYCGGNEECIGVIKKVISKVIEEGTGIPENPPKSEDLISENLAKVIMNSAYEAEKYYTELDYSVIEAACNLAKCEERLAKAIKQEMQHQRSVNAQPACTASYQAYFHGKDAACLDPSIIVHAAPGGTNRNGLVTIKITRKMNIESTGVQQTDADKYRLHVTVNGENGTWSGELYPATLVGIPWIAPGESTYVVVPLQVIGGEINEPLYFGGISHMKAVEACYSPDSPANWVPCLEGGADSWDFSNPPDRYSSEIGQP
jgi:LysM repeat protein